MADNVLPAGAERPRSTAKIFGHPIHPMLVPFPIAFWVGALITDIIYTQSTNPMWTNFSQWLLVGGLLFGGLAAVAGIVDYLGDRKVRSHAAKAHGGINIVVFVIQIFNLLVHSRDGWTSVVPTGLILSIIAVLLLAVSGWLGGELVYKQGVGTPR
jgi:uncharacterized membrane protein